MTDPVPASAPVPTPGTGPSEEPRYGEVFDRGYAHYDGAREGRARAVRSLFGYSVKRALGIRRSWTAKILPALLYFSAFIPVIISVGIGALVPGASLASYSGFYDGIFLLQGIFVATIVPEMLVPDRRERTLPLYFARAITRFDYVFAKIAAAAVLTTTISVIPGIILWLGRQLTAESPVQGMRDNVDDLGRVILMGTLIALTLGTVGLVISSITTRKGVAIAVMVIGFVVLTSLVEVAVLELDQDWRRYLILVGVQQVFSAIGDGLFGVPATGVVEVADFPLALYLGWVSFLVVAGTLFVRWRYSPRHAS